MTTTLKLTIPVLQELVKLDNDFVVQLSHAAVKEIGEKYGDALLQTKIVKDALNKLEKAIVNAQIEAGRILEHKIGQWDNSYNTGYRLREDVKKYIENNFEAILANKFKMWMENKDFNTMLDKLAKQYVEQKVEDLFKKQVGNFLLGK